MTIQFSKQEYQSRIDALATQLMQRDLDGILIFRQESMYYLTGFDTFGYCFFQCLYVSAGGDIALLTRAPDKLQAEISSTIEDIRVWVDQAGHNPAVDLISMLDSFNCKGQRLGVELHAYGLTAKLWRQIEPLISNYCKYEDTSDLVSLLRLYKSPAEQKYVQRAAELADDALDEAIRLTGPGAWEGDILAAMHAAIYRGGGDDPANEFILGSGENSLLCRYHTGRRHIGAQDQLTIEFAGVYRHYHACLMRTIIVGNTNPKQLAMHKACVEGMRACQKKLKPGTLVGEIFDEHAKVMDDHGFRDMRMNACGYSLGTTYAPTWMDFPMFYHGNPIEIEANMVYFLHMILFDPEEMLAMTLGATSLVTEGGSQSLSRHNLDLICA